MQFNQQLNARDYMGAVQPLHIVNGSGFEFHEFNINGNVTRRYRVSISMRA